MSFKKKSLGQHFLVDNYYRNKICATILDNFKGKTLVEIGPGEGSITEKIIPKVNENVVLVELDDRFAPDLKVKFENEKVKIIHGDILKVDWKLFNQEVFICGNFPYNISSQILFKVLEHQDQINGLVAMFQKEVAQRIASKKGSKSYGILSVLLAAFYETEYLFTIEPEAFDPPPKVDSGIILMQKKKALIEIEKFGKFKNLVKLAFHTRRKKLSNSLKSLNIELNDQSKELLDKRPEHLDVEDFVWLTNMCK